MQIAVLGVGLIGGSIGLAARNRLDAEVAGFDPDGGLLDQARELGAIDSAHTSIAEAVAGRDIVFCAAPVGALPALAGEALSAAGEDTAITDVGSVKRPLIAELGDESRFIGGHPLAGAETSGVGNARADLFEGARWYLTPTESSGGVLYDRVQRAIADMGARPQAITADAHDQLMATLSHLPHVIANVLVEHTAWETGGGGSSDSWPDVGPSFRDATRVAGSNPAIWADIFTENREAVADNVAAVSKRLLELAGLLREGDRDAIAAWHAEARGFRRELLEDDVEGGKLNELRVRVPNRPGVVAEVALALGRAGVNIEDMGLYPAADMKSGAISLFVAGDEEAERAAELVRGLGHEVSRVDR